MDTQAMQDVEKKVLKALERGILTISDAQKMCMDVYLKNGLSEQEGLQMFIKQVFVSYYHIMSGVLEEGCPVEITWVKCAHCNSENVSKEWADMGGTMYKCKECSLSFYVKAST